MAFEQCKSVIANAAGRILTPSEEQLVERQTAALLRKIRANEAGEINPLTGVESTVQSEADRIKAERAAQKRRAVHNARARKAVEDYIQSVWADDVASGIRAFVGGLNTPRFGARDSVAAAVSNQRHARVAAFLSDLEQQDLIKVFASGELDGEIRKIALALDNKEAVTKFNPVAVEIAQTIRRHSMAALRGLQAAGSDVQARPGWIAPQSHDPVRISKGGRDRGLKSRSPEAYKAWRDFITPLLDDAESFGGILPADREKLMRSLYTQFATGEHLTFESVGKSRSRQLVFKSPEAEQTYFRQYGYGDSLYESLTHYFDSAGRDIAMMRKLGPSATANLNAVIDAFQKKLSQEGDITQFENLAREAKFIQNNMWPTITGEASVSSDVAVASMSGAWRNLQRMSDLGGMFIASFNDINNAAARIAFTGGRSTSDYFQATAHVARELFENIGKGTSKDAKTLAVENGILLEGVHIPPATAWADTETPGRLARATRMAFQYFGTNWHTNRLRVASLTASTTRYGMHADVAFPDLPAGMQATMLEYGLTPQDWDIVRQNAEMRDYRGVPALTTKAIADLPDSVLDKHPAIKRVLDSGGSDEAVKRARREQRQRMADAYSTLLSDVADAAVTAPTALTKTFTSGGGQKQGSLIGEMSRHFFLFRTYSLAYMERHLGQVLHGYHPDRVGNAAAIARMFADPKQGQLTSLAGLISGGLFYGALSVAAADFITQGKFRPLPETPEDFAKITLAAFTRSGSVGLYNDLFSQHVTERTDFANYFIGLLGPSFGKIADAGDVLFRAITKGWSDRETRDAWRLAYQSAPGRNLFYTRWFTDNLIYHNVAEAIRPGHKADLEAFQTEVLGYQYLTPPTAPLEAIEQ